MRRGVVIALVSSLALASPAFAAFLSMKEARRNARVFAQHVAKQADDDGYELGTCSRISSTQVNCPVTYYFDRGDYQGACTATIRVYIKGGTLYRGHKRKPRCETY